ncbi:MAG: ABC transporter ATP-binding protein [Dehalococcoidaceae bacterium]|nr:ABC transporter ATP-binding protein [Dehalococcoidaceae bacterium]
MAAIKIENLKKYFGNIKAVDGISIEVEKGILFGFLGPNGAGKTTTIRCMMDFIRPMEGSVTILSKDARRDSVELKRKIGYLSGNTRLYDNWDGQTHIDFIKRFYNGEDKSASLVDRLGLDTGKKARHLSSGNRQKLSLILTFMTDPEILILDEPTLGLDPLLQNEVYELLYEFAQNGSTVFMSSHNLAEVERVCSRVGIIKKGKMVASQSIAALKEKKIYIINAHFGQPVNPQEFLDENTELVKELTDGLLLKVKGDINPAIRKLGNYNLAHVEISQPSLEDIFMEYYSNSEGNHA